MGAITDFPEDNDWYDPPITISSSHYEKLLAVVEAAKEIASTKSCSCTRELIAALEALEKEE